MQLSLPGIGLHWTFQPFVERVNRHISPWFPVSMVENVSLDPFWFSSWMPRRQSIPSLNTQSMNSSGLRDLHPGFC
jgi:hypothetical protein